MKIISPSNTIVAVPADETLPLLYSVPQAIYRIPAPYDLVAYADAGVVDLYWENSSNFRDSTQVRYVSGKTTKTITVFSWESHQFTNLKTTQDYTFTVRHFIKDGKKTYYSDWSNPFTIYH